MIECSCARCYSFCMVCAVCRHATQYAATSSHGAVASCHAHTCCHAHIPRLPLASVTGAHMAYMHMPCHACLRAFVSLLRIHNAWRFCHYGAPCACRHTQYHAARSSCHACHAAAFAKLKALPRRRCVNDCYICHVARLWLAAAACRRDETGLSRDRDIRLLFLPKLLQPLLPEGAAHA